MEELPSYKRVISAGEWIWESGKIKRAGAWCLKTTATVEEVDSSIFPITHNFSSSRPFVFIRGLECLPCSRFSQPEHYGTCRGTLCQRIMTLKKTRICGHLLNQILARIPPTFAFAAHPPRAGGDRAAFGQWQTADDLALAGWQPDARRAFAALR